MKILVIIFAVASLASCTSYQKIGSANVVSCRNFETKKEYVLLARYVDSDKVPRNIRALFRDDKNMDPLQRAVNMAVASVPGGEYMANVTVYTMGGTVRVVGDVWGLN